MNILTFFFLYLQNNGARVTFDNFEEIQLPGLKTDRKRSR